MSEDQAAAILDKLDTLERKHDATQSELAAVRRELVMARRHSAKPYYSTDELCHLLLKPTDARGHKAARTWCARKGVTSEGHNKWPRKLIDQILGLD